jgi:hypothetical protein
MGLRERANEASAILRQGDATATLKINEDTGEISGPAEQVLAAMARGGKWAEPDVSESGIAPSVDVPVHVAWQRMMQDVQWLGKNRKGREYMYRGIDDVMNLVGPAERKHGVFVMPTGIEPTFEVINTKSGAVMNYCRAVVHFTIYGPQGDTMAATVLGEAFDNGDKSGTKAQSIALRTLYLNALAIQTNEPARDTEYGTQYELAAPPRPTADQYAAMILADDISVGRLKQIQSELFADKLTGATEVELVDGERIRLVDLVQREGKRLVAAQQKRN